MRQSNRWVLDIVGVLVAVAVLGFFLFGRRAVPPPPVVVVPTSAAATGMDPGPMTLNGVAPGMSQEETVRVLGPPDCHGPLPAAPAKGDYAEYGSPTLTWNGRPTLTFTPDRRVLCVIGTEAEVNGRRAFALQSLEQDVRAAIGGPDRDETNQSDATRHCMTYRRRDALLNVFVTRNRVDRLLWTKVGAGP